MTPEVEKVIDDAVAELHSRQKQDRINWMHAHNSYCTESAELLTDALVELMARRVDVQHPFVVGLLTEIGVRLRILEQRQRADMLLAQNVSASFTVDADGNTGMSVGYRTTFERVPDEPKTAAEAALERERRRTSEGNYYWFLHEMV